VALTLRLIQLLLKHRLAAGLLILLSLVASVYAARTIEVRFQYKDFYDYPGNPRLPLMARYSHEFGDPGGAVVLLVQSPDVFTPEVLGYIDSVTRQLEARDEFVHIRSLTNARAIRAAGDDVQTGPILRQLPASADELRRMREVALGSSTIARHLVAMDGTATAVLAEMRTPASFATIAQQAAAVGLVQRTMDRTPLPRNVQVQVTGAPLVEVETTKALVDDQAVLTPAVLAILVLALAITFRSIHGIVLPLAAVVVSLVWTAGVFSMFGRPIDLLGSTIPTVLLVYGVVDPTFVYTRFMDKLALSRTREQAVTEAMSELLLPCFLTSLTTALGFAAFVTATLPMIKYFGLIVAVGVLFAFITTITVLPLLLVSVAPTVRHSENKPWLALATEELMARIWHVARSKRGLTLCIAGIVLIAGAGAAARMAIRNEYVGILPRGEVQNGVRLLEQKLNGVVRLVVYLEGAPDSMKKPEVLQAIEAVDRLAEQQPLVTSSLSLADLVADTNRAFSGGDLRERRVPASEPLISQYLSLADPADLSDLSTTDYSRSPIRILLTDRGSDAMWQLLDVLQRDLDARFPKLGIQATITGYGFVCYYDSDSAVREVVWGFVIAFCVIILVQLVMFRSLRVALLGIIPNLVPVSACFLVMRALGLHLRMDNSLVMCVSVGALFNTTIHIVARILQQVRAGESNPDWIIGRSLAAVGPPSLYTAVILSLGFSAMGLSRFPGLQALGLLCTVTMLTGFISDAMLTTSLFWTFFDWKRALERAVSRGGRRILDTSGAPGEEIIR
jgi:predicted RND superfamily exporter protein